MGKFLSKEDLEIAVVRAFQIHKKAQKLHVTPDGQCFLEGNKSFADLHARKNKWTSVTVERKDYEVPTEEPVIDYSEGKKRMEEASSALGTKEVEPSGIELMTVATLKEELTKRSIAFDPKAKKPVLVQLLKDAVSAQMA